ncbi:MAG: quinolinate synthase NadA [Magnetospiraceae bacterium]
MASLPLKRTDVEAPGLLSPETLAVREKTRSVFNDAEWDVIADTVDEILALKKQRNAIILAHNYQTRDIYHCVADIVGDSLALARKAAEAEADVIVLCGVHFMAETAKILNPEKTVLIPDLKAGCSLAESITAADVRALKAQYPGVPVVTYVNTSADVKAECDVCCTSANAVEIVEALGVERVILVPDEYLAKNVDAKTDVEIITFPGRCEVHELYKEEDIHNIRTRNPGTVILAHPECAPEVLNAADFSGSTTGMADFVKREKPDSVALITECSMSDNIRADNPDTNFIMSCTMCPHMKRITLDGVADSLRNMTHEVFVDSAISERARASVQAMLDLS